MDNGHPGEGPKLPGITPIGGENGPPVETVNPLLRLVAQFFVIPMAIVLFCVGLVFVFRWLTWEKRDVTAYLNALGSASRAPAQKQQDALQLLNYIQEAKRWQGIYDVTQELRFNREGFLAEHRDFPARVAEVFRQASGGDRQVRQYLAQVLGLVGGPESVAVLLGALDDADSETVVHSLVALGRIGDSAALPALLQASQSADRGIRQTAIFVLGNFNDPGAIARCAEALNDADLLVSWNAAFALARNHDPRAAPVLERFLDLDFIERSTRAYQPTGGTGTGAASRDALPTFNPERLEQYRVIAVRLLGQFADPKILKELETTAGQDKQLKVRQAAIETLNRQRGGAKL